MQAMQAAIFTFPLYVVPLLKESKELSWHWLNNKHTQLKAHNAHWGNWLQPKIISKSKQSLGSLPSLRMPLSSGPIVQAKHPCGLQSLQITCFCCIVVLYCVDGLYFVVVYLIVLHRTLSLLIYTVNETCLSVLTSSNKGNNNNSNNHNNSRVVALFSFGLHLFIYLYRTGLWIESGL